MGVLGTMFTMTTHGTWPRGDRRSWVDDGRVLPPDPELEEGDRQRMKHALWLFGKDQVLTVGTMIGESLQSRLQQRILALTVQTWHVHFVVAASEHGAPDVVKCAKEAVRYGMRPGRPIWTDGYDKRYCFDAAALGQRIEYVERHNTESGMPPRPWKFIEPYDGH